MTLTVTVTCDVYWPTRNVTWLGWSRDSASGVRFTNAEYGVRSWSRHVMDGSPLRNKTDEVFMLRFVTRSSPSITTSTRISTTNTKIQPNSTKKPQSSVESPPNQAPKPKSRKPRSSRRHPRAVPNYMWSMYNEVRSSSPSCDTAFVSIPTKGTYSNRAKVTENWNIELGEGKCKMVVRLVSIE